MHTAGNTVSPRLVDVAHSLLKMAPFDLECIKLEGLQKYMRLVFPLTDWSLETMRPALMTIIRRLDKLFAKVQKSAKVTATFTRVHFRLLATDEFQVYHAVDWSAAAGLLRGVYLTLWRHPYIVNVPNLKSLIGTCQCLVVGEDSLTSLTDHHVGGGGLSGKRPDLPPEEFCTIVFRLIALQVRGKKKQDGDVHAFLINRVLCLRQVLVLGNAFTLEQRLQLNEHPAGGASRYSLLTHDKGESLLLNLLLPLCLKVKLFLFCQR